MAIFKPFKGFRPQKELVHRIASRPYDVLDSDEARDEVKDNPHSFLHVVKPEVDLPADIDLHAQAVYEKGRDNLNQLIGQGIFQQDENAIFYVYAQTMDGRRQYGLVGCSGVQDYLDNIIKKHELTRPDKEEDRMNHVRVTNFNAEPVFFAYKANAEIDAIVAKTVAKPAQYDFTTEDGIGHHFWVMDQAADVARVEQIFREQVPFTYVADGHHRTAAAALVGAERRKNNPAHTGQEEYNFFLTVIFPDNQLRIIDYNRVVKDLNGHSKEAFLAKLAENFELALVGAEAYKPAALHNFAMYLDGQWYSLTAKPGTYDDRDPIGVLDVTILSKHVLEPILDIKDLRRSTRVEFVGGIRGLGELKRRVDNGQMVAAFALFPVSMQQLMDIADNDLIMPPKVTWFEPKLRSGLVLHSLD